MLICKLTHGIELHADFFGNPFYVYPPSGLRPAGYCGEVLSHVEKEDSKIVTNWQKDPQNDCLRARGDARWQAACIFTSLPVWEQ